mgnify:CR=1 FL=1
MRPILPFKLGRLEVFFLSDGEIWLDGGSTFGTVPRVLWTKLTEPDAQNRIRLGLNPLLLRYGERWILVETGIDRKPASTISARKTRCWGNSPSWGYALRIYRW